MGQFAMPSAETARFHPEHSAPMVMPADRLPVGVAVPVVATLSLLCWLAVWAVARLVF